MYSVFQTRQEQVFCITMCLQVHNPSGVSEAHSPSHPSLQDMSNIQDTVPHINISDPLHVMQEQWSLGRGVLDQTYMLEGVGPKMHTSRKE